ncbi:MAG: HDOD domain-containing protein [Deltaproteobacteria bacterium]|nr:HDOD domain-containing protein [Deltaproteobacteria bacterium]
MSGSGSASEKKRIFEVVCPGCGKRLRIGRDVKLIEVEEGESDAGLFAERDEAFREKIVERILAKNYEVPLLPHVALRVMRLTGDASVSMQDMAKVILTDQGISSRILQIANSPVYGAAVEIQTISQALVRLGQNEVKNLMLAISMHSRIFKSAVYKKLAQQLWEHSIAVAFAARVVANALRLPREEAFLAGLMHDVGKMVLLTIMESAQKLVAPGFMPSDRTVHAILAQYGADVGEMVAKSWDMPHHMADAIARMPHLHEMREAAPETAAVALANDIAVIRGIGPDRAEIALVDTPGARLLNLSVEACDELLVRFDQIHEQARGVFL